MDRETDTGQRLYAVCPGKVFTGLDGKAEKGLCILVENEKIKDVIRTGELPDGIRKVELAGTTLLPGFVDAHAHVDDWMMPLLLAYGITSVRDTGSDPGWIFDARERYDDASSPGPSIFCCGPMLDAPPCYHTGISLEISTADDIRDAVSFLRREKADAVKLYEGLSLDMVGSCTREAGKWGLHVLGHFGGRISLAEAIGAGVDEAEHLAGIPGDLSEEIIEKILYKDTWIVPTQVVYETIFHEAGGCERYIPDSISAYWDEYRKNIRSSQRKYESTASLIENHRRYLEALIRGKARIAVGTDAPYQLVVPGISYADELYILSQCGMSNTDVLRCATSGGAALLGIIDRAGTIEPGKQADMTVVAGDPFADIRKAAGVVTVFKKGRMYDPFELLGYDMGDRKSRFEGLFKKYAERLRFLSGRINGIQKEVQA